MVKIIVKIASILIAATLVSILGACGGEGGLRGETETSPAETETAAPETEPSATKKSETTPKQTEPTAEEPLAKASRVNPNDPDFYIVYTEGDVDFTSAPKAYIDIYRWKQDYMPEAFAQAVFKEGEGFYVRMECAETDPVATYTEHNDPVYLDSCLEFFAVYLPDSSNKYVNIEMNANGAYLCYFCDSIQKNIKMNTLTKDMPVVTPFKTETSWGVELFVPLEMIADAYGSSDIGEGDKILANFYKCGDKTAIIHHGSWNEVKSEKPNFHLPEYFAEIEIRRPE